MKVFYLGRDYYSVPQTIVIVAKDREEAEAMLSKRLEEENEEVEFPGELLEELDISKSRLLVLEPPGDRHMMR